MNFARSYIDRYSRGKTINFDASRTGDVYNIIKRFIDRKAFPVDPNGIYMVMASGDVEKKAFGTTYCGYV